MGQLQHAMHEHAAGCLVVRATPFRHPVIPCLTAASSTRHKEGEPQYSPGMTTSLIHPTNDTRKLVDAVLCCLRRIYREEFRYIKAGVMLSDITPAGISQGDFFAEPSSSPAK